MVRARIAFHTSSHSSPHSHSAISTFLHSLFLFSTAFSSHFQSWIVTESTINCLVRTCLNLHLMPFLFPLISLSLSPAISRTSSVSDSSIQWFFPNFSINSTIPQLVRFTFLPHYRVIFLSCWIKNCSCVQKINPRRLCGAEIDEIDESAGRPILRLTYASPDQCKQFVENLLLILKNVL